MADEKYKFNDFLKTQFLQGFVQSMNPFSTADWIPYQPYYAGDIVEVTDTQGFTQVTKRYICVTRQGKSGTRPPIHTGKGEIRTDGGVRWMFIDIKYYSTLGQENLYVTFGQQGEWRNNELNKDVEITPAITPERINNIIYAYRIDRNNVAVVVPKNLYRQGQVFDKFSSTASSYTHPHYTTTDTGNIYFCLDNNNGQPSQIKPDMESSEPISTTDGYTWLYLGRLETTISRFSTEDLIPLDREILFNAHISKHKGGIASVNTNRPMAGLFEQTDELEAIFLNKGAGAEAELIPIINASGAVERVNIVKAGHDYSHETRVIIKNKNAIGSGATGEIEVDAKGSITSIKVLNNGENYDKAVIILESPTGRGFVGKPVISTEKKIVDVEIKDDGRGEGYDPATTKVYFIAGNAGMVSDVSLLPNNLTQLDLMASLGNASLMFYINIPANSSFFPNDVYYREVMIVSNLKDSLGQIARKREYAGVGSPIAGLSPSDRLGHNEGYILFRQISDKKLHKKDQREQVRIIVSL